MAFTGTPVVHYVSDRKVRITGVSLARNVSGTIALHGHAAGPDVILPAWFQPVVYNNDHGDVTLQDSIEVTVHLASATASQVSVAVNVIKTGTTPADFLAEIYHSTRSRTPRRCGSEHGLCRQATRSILLVEYITDGGQPGSDVLTQSGGHVSLT
jgi:hypothetical protein